MKNNFRVISMCSLMAAFAASSWAATTCPEGTGWSKEGDVCYYDIQDGEQTPTIPSSLKSFKLRYKGDVDIDYATVHLDNPKGTQYTYSVSGSAQLEEGGYLIISNRLNLAAYAGSFAGLLPMMGLQTAYTEDEMSSCSVENCNIAKETGFNALTVEFGEGVEGIGQSFELTVTQELFDFTSLEVYHTKGVTPSTVQEIATKAGSLLPSDFPLDKIKAAINAGYESLALLHGNGENDKLTSIPADIDVGYVYLNRTFSSVANARSTIALPFSIATDKIAGASEIWQFTRVGKDPNNSSYDAVYMKKVYCAAAGEKCPETNGTLEAYKPYIVVMKSGVTSLKFNGPVTLKGSSMEPGFADFTCQNGSNWVFRGAFEKITWNDDPKNVYGYAASGANEGQFVRVAGEGVFVNPFRAFLINVSPSGIAPANSSYALRQNVLPNEMNIVIEGDNNETTVIGSFNTRTGEMKFINNMKHTYDLKGRRVNGTNNARGAYYGKKVLMK